MKLFFAAFAFLFFNTALFSQNLTLAQTETVFDAPAVSHSAESDFFTSTIIHGEAPAPGENAGAAGPLADSVDLAVSLNWLDTFTVGYPAKMEFYYQNKSSQAAANVKLLFVKDSRTNFFKTSLPFSATSGDTAIWNFGTLAPGQSGSIMIELRLPETTAIINQLIETKAFIYPFAGDKDTTNNKSRLLNRVRGAAQYIQKLSLSLSEENKPQPGGTARYKLLYGYNSWLDSVKGRIIFIKDPALLFVASQPAGAYAKGDTVYFPFNNAGPFFDTASVSLQFKLASQKSFGTQIKNHAFIRPTVIDVVQPEARDTLVQTIQLWYNGGDVTPLTDRQGIQWIKPVTEGPAIGYFMSAIDTTKSGAILAAGTAHSKDGKTDGIIIQKMNRDGTSFFQKVDTVKGIGEVIRVTEFPDGALVVAGNSSRTVAGIKSIVSYGWVRLYDSVGNLKWHRDVMADTVKAPIRQNNFLRGITIAPENAVYAVGQTQFVDSMGNGVYSDTTHGRSWVCRINYQGAITFQKPFGLANGIVQFNDITQAHDFAFIVVGYKTPMWPYNKTSIAYKISGSGNLIWEKSFSAERDEDFLSVVKQKDGYVIGGYVDESQTQELQTRGRITKLDFNGNKMWETKTAVSDFMYFYKVKADENNGIVSLGFLQNSNFSNPISRSIVRYDSSGALLSLKVLNTSGYISQFSDIAALGAEEYAVAGTLADDFLNHQYVHPEQRGGAVIKLGNNNTITGTVYLDENGNGKKDASEKYLNNILVKSESAGFTASSSATVDGVFKNFIGRGRYITMPVLNNPNFSARPASDTSTFNSWFGTDTLQFAVVPLGNKADLQVHLLPVTPARPGFATTYKITYFNAGNTTFSNTHIRFQKGSRQTYLESSQPGATVVADTIRWNMGTIAPLTGGAFEVRLRNSTPPALNNGDTLFLKAAIEPATADATPADNIAAFQHIVQGSFDPNDKQELNNGVYTQEQAGRKEYFNYLIRFQNTGTDTAFRVIVRDTLDKNLDWTSLEMLSASHPYSLRIKNGNQHEWVFENVNLPDSNRNEPGSHGHIAFRIKPKAAWVVGDSIRNRASIYFDFNLPVKTNTVRTLFKPATVTAIPENNALDAAISVYPNPTPDELWTTIKGHLRGTLTLTVYDNHGRRVLQQHHGRINTQAYTAKINTAQLATGIYFMHIAIDGKKNVYKIAVQ